MHPHLMEVRLSGRFLRLQSEGTPKKTAAYRKTLRTAKQTQASVPRVGRLDRAEQGRSVEGHRCGRDVGKEAGTQESHATHTHLVIPTGIASSWATEKPVYCFNRS